MATSIPVAYRQAPGPSPRANLWLRSPSWDLCYLIGSGTLVVFPLLLYAVVGQAALVVNLVIAAVIGGPHMYATFLRTFLDRRFWQAHRGLAVGSLGIPVLVVLCAHWDFALLITLFFCWASLHVVHQILYLLACYERQQAQSTWSRYIDYAVVVSCLYPFAIYHCIYGTFTIGAIPLLYPDALKAAPVFYAVTGFFLLALSAFLGKTLLALYHGTAYYPRLLLIGTTVSLALFITSFSGQRLEIAFQGFNTWHSFQYLALNWHLHNLRQQRGERPPYLWAWLATRSWHRVRTFYGLMAAITLGSLLLIVGVTHVTGLTLQHSYYVVVLSCLLIHYCHDHVLFTQVEDVVPSVPVGDRG